MESTQCVRVTEPKESLTGPTQSVFLTFPNLLAGTEAAKQVVVGTCLAVLVPTLLGRCSQGDPEGEAGWCLLFAVLLSPLDGLHQNGRQLCL